MHLSFLKFALMAAGAALGAVLGIFSYAFTVGKDPSDDGPRALLAEFLGAWIGFFFLIWSFTIEDKTLQWTMRGAAAFSVVAGLSLSAYLGNTTEVSETPDKEPTGFKNDTTSIHLE